MSSRVAVIVVGGQCSKVGKTAVACALIKNLDEFRWTAIKTSPHHHLANEGTFLVDEDALPATDTGRYLEAGAKRAILISGDLSGALPRLQQEIDNAEMTMIESNSVLEFLKPEVLFFVLDLKRNDFKDSARRWIEHADALLARSGMPDAQAPGVPRFPVGPGQWAPAGLIDFLKEKLTAFGPA